MIIDLFIAIFAVVMIILVAKRQIKLYKKDGAAAFCSGSCTSCNKSCSFRKN